MMACIYLTCISFVFICLGLLLRYNGINIFKLLRYLREELFIVFGTASSESVLPRMISKLENFGCSKPLVGWFCPPVTRSISTALRLSDDGRALHRSSDEHPPDVWSAVRGAGCLPAHFQRRGDGRGSAFITLAATLASHENNSVEGMVLIFGVDWFMAQARAMTNMVGNGVATIVIAKWENEFDPVRAKQVLNEPTFVPVEKTVQMPGSPAEAIRDLDHIG